MKNFLLAVVLLATYVSASRIKPLTGCESIKSCPSLNGPIAIHKEHPFRCDSFCKCDWGKPVYFKCPDGLHFNKELEVCDWPEKAGCKGSGGEGTTPSGGIEEPPINLCEYVRCANNNTDPLTNLPIRNVCVSYCQCFDGVPIWKPCAPGLHFNKETQLCEHPLNAGCDPTWTEETSTAKPTSSPVETTTKTTSSPINSTPALNGCKNVICPPTNEGNATHWPNPEDCSSFCKCDWGKPVWFACPPGLHFNPALQVCDWPINVGCVPGNTDPENTTPSSGNTTPGSGNTTPGSGNTTPGSGNTTPGSGNTTPGSTAAPNGCEKVICPPTNEGNATHWPNPEDCSSFCKCDWGKPVWFACPPGLHFNPALQVCDWPINVGCVPGNTDPENTTPSSGNTTPGSGNTTPGSGNTTPGSGNTTPGGVNTTPGSTAAPNGCEKVICPPTNEGNATHWPNPEDCSSFCKCDWGKPVWFACPPGLHFNPALQVCDWPINVGCVPGNTDPENTTPSSGNTTPGSGNTTPGSGNTTPGSGNTTPGSTAAPNGCEKVICPPTNEGNATHWPNPEDCSSFCKCDWGKPVWFACPPGLHFNPALQVCDWPINVGCVPGDTENTTPSSGNTTPGGENTTPGGGNTTPGSGNTTPGSGNTTPGGVNTTPGSTAAPNGCEKVICPPTNEGNATHWPNPEDCSSFCKCDWGKPIWFACPPGLHFNPALQVCDWPINVGCVPGNTDPENTTPGSGNTTPGGGNTTPGGENTTPGGGNTTPGGVNTTPGSTAAPNGCENVICPPTNEGNATHWPNPEDCSSFCKCDWGKPIWFACPPGLHFNPALQVCDWPINVGCVPGNTDPENTTPGSGNTTPSGVTTTPGSGNTTPGIGNTTPSGIDQCDKAKCIIESCGTNVPNPGSCSSYCKCENGIGIWKPCPPGLFFNPEIQICDWPDNSNCNEDTGESTTKPSVSTTRGSGSSSTPRPTCPKVKCPSVNGEFAVHLPNPDDCGSFCKCDWGVAYYFDCPDGLHFNADLEVCDWPMFANCGSSADALA